MNVVNNLFCGAPGEGQEDGVGGGGDGAGGGAASAAGGAGVQLLHSHPLLPNNAQSLQAPQVPPSNDYFPFPPAGGEQVAWLSPSSSVGEVGGGGGGDGTREDVNLQMSAQANSTH